MISRRVQKAEFRLINFAKNIRRRSRSLNLYRGNRRMISREVLARDFPLLLNKNLTRLATAVSYGCLVNLQRQEITELTSVR